MVVEKAAFMLLLVGILHMLAVVMAQDVEPEERDIEMAIADAEPREAILFPWFTEALGIIVFFILTRWLQALPYTAVVFVIGIGMGVGASRTLNSDQLTTSILQWTQIDSEVLLIVFLPGLTFSDAFDLNVHLFMSCFWQIINFAFPMVLAGTALTACVAFYLFPYGWSFNLAMTFGAILSATDVAAVAALMSSLGAPPRLQMHIGGESMLNDGSSFVFYTIFSALFLTELGIPGVGETVNLGQGVAIFFREGFGAAAFGIAFGLGLTFLLYMLNRKLDDSENVVQIVATITVAYLAYYTADIADCSGVISVVAAGITSKAYGSSMINQPEMMDTFWAIVEQLLNTLLFTLSGVVFGVVISDSSGEGIFKAKDWGLLFMNYVLLNIIRIFLIFSFYPLTRHIGLGTNWQETFFSGFAGLRGGVGTALALSLYNQVFEATDEADGVDDLKYQRQVTQLFAQVTGIVFLTLTVNGTAAGPVLNKLGLSKSSDSRTRLLKQLDKHFRSHFLDQFVNLLSDPRFSDVKLPTVQKFIPYLQNLTYGELKAACLRNPRCKPNLRNVLPYLNTEGQDLSWANMEPSEAEPPKVLEQVPEAAPTADKDKDEKDDVIELRHFFLEILQTVYQSALEDGELDGRNSFVSYSLIQSLDFASSDVDKGKPLDDWNAAHITDKQFSNCCVDSATKYWEKTVNKKYCCIHYSKSRVGDDRAHTFQYRKLKMSVLRALSFMEAHRQARNTFKKQLSDSSDENANVQLVLDESTAETDAAREELNEHDQDDVAIITAHYFCTVLLNKAGRYAEKLLKEGVLQPKEASTICDEVDECLMKVAYSSEMDNADQFKDVSKHVDDSTKAVHDKPQSSTEQEEPVPQHQRPSQVEYTDTIDDVAADTPPVEEKKRGSIWA